MVGSDGEKDDSGDVGRAARARNCGARVVPSSRASPMAIPRAEASARANASGSPSGESDHRDETNSGYVVRPLLSSAVVKHVVLGRFRRTDARDIVLAKIGQLQLLTESVDRDASTRGRAWKLTHQQPLYPGTLVDIKAVRGGWGDGGRPGDDVVSANSRTDALAALSNSGKLSVLRFDSYLGRFVAARQLQLGQPGFVPTPAFNETSVGTSREWIRCWEEIGLAPPFDKIAAHPRGAALAVRCATHASVFRVVGCERDESPPDDAALDFEAAGTPLRPNGFITIDAAFIAGIGWKGAAFAMLLAEETRGEEMTTDAAEVSEMDEDGGVEEPPADSEATTSRDAVAGAARGISDDEASIERELARGVEGDAGSTPRDDASTGNSGRVPTHLDIFANYFALPPTWRVELSAPDVSRAIGCEATLVESPSDAVEGKMTTANAYVLGEHGVVIVTIPDGSRSSRSKVASPVLRVIMQPNVALHAPRTWCWARADSFGRRGAKWTWRLITASPEGDCVHEALRVDVRGVVDDSPTATNGNRVEYRTGICDPVALSSLGGTATVVSGDGTVCDAIIAFSRDGAAAKVPFDRCSAIKDVSSPAVASDAAALLSDHPEGATLVHPCAPADALAGISPDASPQGFAPQSDSAVRSFVATAGGSVYGVALGVACTSTVVSGGGFSEVREMWALRCGEEAPLPGKVLDRSRNSSIPTLLALSFSDATRVFVRHIGSGTEATFEEAVDGAGFDRRAPTVACSDWPSIAGLRGSPSSEHGVVAQVTPRGARIIADGAVLSEWCPRRSDGAIGASAIESSRGRIAMYLPGRGAVMILASVGETIGRTSRQNQHEPRKHVLVTQAVVRFASGEPSCLVLPPPALAAALAEALVDGGSRRLDRDAEGSEWTLVLAGTYGREVEIVATHEDSSADAKNSDFSSPALFTSRASLGVSNDAGGVGAPACALVTTWGVDNRPCVLITTRTGEAMLLEAGTPPSPDAGLPLPRPPPPRQPRSVSNRFLAKLSDGRAKLRDGDVDVVRIGGRDSLDGGTEGSAKRLCVPSPLEQMFEEPPAEAIRHEGTPPLDSAGGNAASRGNGTSICVTYSRRLSRGPLQIIPLGDEIGGVEVGSSVSSRGIAALLRGDDGAWIARDTPGSLFRLSIAPLCAPGMRRATPFDRSNASFLAIDASAGGRLAIIVPDVEQRDAACRVEMNVPESTGGFKFVARDSSTGLLLAATTRGVRGGGSHASDDDARDFAAWRVNLAFPGYGGADLGEGEESSSRVIKTLTGMCTPWSLDGLENVGFRGEDPSGAYISALATLEPPLSVKKGCGLVAVGQRGPMSSMGRRLRRRERLAAGDENADVVEDGDEEGRLSVFTVHPDGSFGPENFAALPAPVECISPAGPGRVLVGAGDTVYLMRLTSAPGDDGAENDKVKFSLEAQKESGRGRVVALAAYAPRPGDVSDSITVAIATERDGVTLVDVKPSIEGNDGAFKMRFEDAAADPVVRNVVALTARGTDEVAGIDAESRVFVLRRTPKRERDLAAVGNARVLEKNLSIQASFNHRVEPSAAAASDDGSLVVATSDGGVSLFAELSMAEFAVLREAQLRAEAHLAPVLGDSSRGGGKDVPEVIDGYLLEQFAMLPAGVQRDILSGMPVQATISTIQRALERVSKCDELPRLCQ